MTPLWQDRVLDGVLGGCVDAGGSSFEFRTTHPRSGSPVLPLYVSCKLLHARRQEKWPCRAVVDQLGERCCQPVNVRGLLVNMLPQRQSPGRPPTTEETEREREKEKEKETERKREKEMMDGEKEDRKRRERENSPGQSGRSLLNNPFFGHFAFSAA
jgi:hypothetical protein